MVRFTLIASAVLAMSAGMTIASDSPHEDLIASRSSADGNKAVSKAIDDALAAAGFNATEAEKVRGVYHVGVDQINDDSDKSRQLLDSALSKILSQADVKKVDDALDVLVGKLGGLVSRDVDAAAGGDPAPAVVSGAPMQEVSRPKSPPMDEEAWRKFNQEIRDKLQKLYPHLNFGGIPEGCDCKKTIDIVKQPGPQGGMTYEWHQKWEHKGMNLACVDPCVGQALGKFTEKMQGFRKQEIMEKYGGGVAIPGKPTHLTSPRPHSKREEASEQSEQEESVIPITQTELPQPGNLESYRTWYETTQKSGKYCTCEMKKSIWDLIQPWVIHGRPQHTKRCAKFCRDAVGPWLDKENKTLSVPLIPRPNLPKPIPVIPKEPKPGHPKPTKAASQA